MAKEHSNRSGGYPFFFRGGRAVCLKLAGVAVYLAATAAPAMAARPNGHPVGVVAYPFSHLLFMAAMAVLIYRLSRRGTPVRPGWIAIRYSAIFFILWSAFAFTAFFLEDPTGWIAAGRIGSWTLHIEPAGKSMFLAWIYYLARLDHLLCVPAMFFFVLGLVRLSAQTRSRTSDDSDDDDDPSFGAACGPANGPAGDTSGDRAESERKGGV